MQLSVEAAKLARKYASIVDKYENHFASSGYSAIEFEAVRTRAHNALLAQLAKEGVDLGKDRAKTTEWALLFDRWIRGDEGDS